MRHLILSLLFGAAVPVFITLSDVSQTVTGTIWSIPILGVLVAAGLVMAALTLRRNRLGPPVPYAPRRFNRLENHLAWPGLTLGVMMLAAVFFYLAGTAIGFEPVGVAVMVSLFAYLIGGEAYVSYLTRAPQGDNSFDLTPVLCFFAEIFAAYALVSLVVLTDSIALGVVLGAIALITFVVLVRRWQLPAEETDGD